MSDYLRSMTDFWSAQGKAMLDAQEQAARRMTEGMQAMLSGKMPAMPDGSTDLGAVTAEFAQAGEALTRLWSAAGGLSSELVGRLGRTETGPGDDVVTATFRRMLDPQQWLMGTGELDDVLARMAEGPRLADLWDLERRYARVMKGWTELRRRTMDHQRIVLEAWVRAGRRFAEELAGHAGVDGRRSLEPKRAFQLWTEVANQQLLETQRSEPFLQSQREMIRASTGLRLAQQDMVDHFGKQYGFPTRTELDDVHRSLTEMRRELRRMRRALAEAQAQATAVAPPAPSAPAPPPARTSNRKRT